MDFRPVVLVMGVALATLAFAMGIPATVDAFWDNPDWQVFVVAAGVTLFVGVAMALASHAGPVHFGVRQIFAATAAVWLVVSVFAALPLMFADLGLSFTNAFFEAVSGLTATGSTVLTGLDSAPPGILVWRALLQWLGGLGVILMAITVLPMLRVGGMHIFRIEASERMERTLPRAAQFAFAIVAVYVALTIVWAAAYWLAGMTGLEAFVHAMTTLATGGFSTSDGSIGHFDNALIDAVATAGMLIGGLPFILLIKTLQGDGLALFRDSQVRWFIAIVVLAIGVAAAWLWLDGGFAPLQALRFAAFNVTSVITGTGYVTSDYGLWGTFSVPIFFYLMFVGGCAGSATSGLKVFRLQVLYATASTQVHHLLQPHGVFVPHFNRRPISDDVIISVLGFFFIFGICFTVLALGLAALGLDMVTSFSGAATAIANVGPGLGGIIGPAGTFKALPDAAKWLLAIGMLLGRLEVFVVFVLFTRAFWRG